MNEQTARSLVAALELLRRAVVDQTTAALLAAKAATDAAGGKFPAWAAAAAGQPPPTAGKPPPGGPKAGEAPRERGGAGTVATMLAGLFGKILVPLVSLAAVLGQASSGFGLFTKSLNVFASAVAPLLLPVFAVLAAAVVAVSDEIWSALLPNLRDWYGWILSNAIPTFQTLVEATRAVIQSFKTAATLFGYDYRKPGGAQLQPGYKPVSPQEATERRRLQDNEYRPQGFSDWDKNKQNEWFMERDRKRMELGRVPWMPGGEGPGTVTQPAAVAPGTPGGPARGTPKATFDGALRDVVRSLQMSIGPKASYSALTEVGKQAQLTALNTDPLDARVIRRTLDSLQELLKAIADNTGKQAAGGPVHPTGRP